MTLYRERYNFDAPKLFKPITKNTEQLLKDLKTVVRERSEIPICYLEDILLYYIKYEHLARELLDRGRISDDRCKKLFWDGLDKTARKIIRKELDIKKNAIPSVRRVCKAACRAWDIKKVENRKETKIGRGSTWSDPLLNEVCALVETLHMAETDSVRYATAYACLLLLAPVVADRISPPSGWVGSNADSTGAEGGARTVFPTPAKAPAVSVPRNHESDSQPRASTAGSGSTQRGIRKSIVCEASITYDMKRIEKFRDYGP